jgi:hypothetical protein
LVWQIAVRDAFRCEAEGATRTLPIPGAAYGPRTNILAAPLGANSTARDRAGNAINEDLVVDPTVGLIKDLPSEQAKVAFAEGIAIVLD